LTMFVIRGCLQDYAWGVPGGLNSWLPEPAGDGPQAELWFGAHPNGPSPLVGRPGTLVDVVDPMQVPLLVKLLAASKPLSIQIHPKAELARGLFAEQDPNDALLPDYRAKIEMLIAIEDFEVFAGTRRPEVAARLLTAADPRLVPVADALRRSGFTAAVAAVMALPPLEIPDLSDAVLRIAPTVGLDPAAVTGLRIAAESFPGDPGVLVAVLLAHDVLAAGEAVYLPAGVAHAYIRGFGLEVMTASDNVLRLGMTPKRIALAEALAAVDPAAQPQRLGDTADHPGVTDYQPKSAPFEAIALRTAGTHVPAGAYRMVLAVNGSVSVSGAGEQLVLAPGEAAVVLATEPAIDVAATGLGFVIMASLGSTEGGSDRT
jgi:mannose-6-phosphate isomerase